MSTSRPRTHSNDLSRLDQYNLHPATRPHGTAGCCLNLPFSIWQQHVIYALYGQWYVLVKRKTSFLSLAAAETPTRMRRERLLLS